mmetsp:Transcript_20815/g.23540  ORF Transcript_20815/g.23540 Transcript_20815/m.23540 type:complete len:160 (-) Transcript_20815:189-668(-)
MMTNRVVKARRKQPADHHHLHHPDYSSGARRDQTDLRKRLDLPVLRVSYANLFVLLNIILPGWGTMLSAFTPFQINNPDYRETKPKQLLIGLMQFVLTLIIIGWIWSIVWACMLRSVATKYEHHDREDTIYHVLEEPLVPDQEAGEREEKVDDLYRSSP